MNFVFLTAALSSCSSGVVQQRPTAQAAGQRRTRPGPLQHHEQGPRPRVGRARLRRRDADRCRGERGVPEQAFIYISSIATLGAIWGWLVIILCHMIYRRRLARGEVTRSWFRLPFATTLSLLVIAFMAFLTVILGVDPENRIALYTIPLWAGILIGGYLLAKPGMAAREAAATAALQQTQASAVAGL